MKKKVTITITNWCNLKCTYCYECFKSKVFMSFDTAKKIILNEFLCIKDDDSLLIDFMGGEPFLNFSLMKEIVEYFKNSVYKNRISYFVSTNGTLLTDDIKNWLIKNKEIFVCGLSMDGREDSQNTNRSNSFSLIDTNFFHTTWPDSAVKMTISPYSIKNLAEDVIFFHELGFKVMNNFAFGVDWTKNTLRDILRDELEKLIDYYVNNPSIVPCQILNLDIGLLAYRHEFTKTATCGAGTKMTVYDVFANKYPCHFFAPLSIGEKKSKLSELIQFKNISTLIDEKCSECSIYCICKTCYGSNFNATGDPKKRDKNICIFTKISAYYTALLCLEKIRRYGIDNLSWDEQKQKEICLGIEDIYNTVQI